MSLSQHLRAIAPLTLGTCSLLLLGTFAIAGDKRIDNDTASKGKDLARAWQNQDTDNNANDASQPASLKIAALNPQSYKQTATDALFSLQGDRVQGGMLIGQTLADARVTLDGRRVLVGDQGRFILGFHRDHPATAQLSITLSDKRAASEVLTISPRSFKEERIDGVPQSTVSGYTKEQLEKISISTEKKKSARLTKAQDAYWASGFDWPVTGRISGVFGSRRILNGEPKRPHSGVDVAVPTGTPIKAPADGIIRLADPDMYFEGGLVLIDHGHELESAIMHMSRIDVSAGQIVRQGEIIGAVGATGRATGPHMHWSLKWQNRLLDAQLVVPEMVR